MERLLEERETNLLDLLVLISENIKVLILGPVIAGLLVFGSGYVVPPRFTSQAILALPAPFPGVPATPTLSQASSMITSPFILDPVIRSLNLATGYSVQEARARLLGQIKVTTKDGLLFLDVSADTPLGAQALATTVIDAWLKSTAPRERERADMEKRLQHAETTLKYLGDLLRSVTKDGANNSGKSSIQGEGGVSIVEMQKLYLNEVLAIRRVFDGLTRDVIVQMPSLPTESVKSSVLLSVSLAALSAVFVLLFWIFLRQSWKQLTLAPFSERKLAKIRHAFGISDR